jgi:hypothetical protein
LSKEAAAFSRKHFEAWLIRRDHMKQASLPDGFDLGGEQTARHKNRNKTYNAANPFQHRLTYSTKSRGEREPREQKYFDDGGLLFGISTYLNAARESVAGQASASSSSRRVVARNFLSLSAGQIASVIVSFVSGI